LRFCGAQQHFLKKRQGASVFVIDVTDQRELQDLPQFCLISEHGLPGIQGRELLLLAA
jgi:hypothetical protein